MYLTLAMAFAAGAVLGAPPARAPHAVLLGSFEVPGTWGFDLGTEFPGAQGRLDIDHADPHSGSACARLSGDFAGGGAYVAATRRVDPPLPLAGVSFWARTRDVKAVPVRLTDATGQVHVTSVALPPDGKWHRLEVGVPDKGWGHWSGANDGVFHQPLVDVDVLLDKGSLVRGTSGTLWIDDVTVETTKVMTQATFTPRAARLRLDNLEMTATPANPEWGAWVLEVRLDNLGAAPATATVAAEPLYVAPWDEVTAPPQTVEVLAGGTTVAGFPLPAPVSQRMANRIRVTLTSGEGSGGATATGPAATATATAAFAGAEAPDAPPGTPRPATALPASPFGVCIHCADANRKLLSVVADAGLRWARTDFMWEAFERQKGKLACPPGLDQMVDLGRKMGIEWMCLLNGGNQKCYPDDPYNPAAFARFAAFVAEHFRGRITWFEILNEPLGQMGKHGYWQNYDRVVNAAAAAIKKVRPDAVVVADTAYPHDTFVFAPRFSDLVDGVTLHPYPYQGIAEQGHFSADPPFPQKDGTFRSEIECVRDWLGAAKCGKRVALTEFGWPTYWPGKQIRGYEAVTEETQAKYLTRRMIEAFALGCDPVMLYDAWDDFTAPHNPEAHFGLVNNSGGRKPAWWAVARVCSMLGDARPWTPDFKVTPQFSFASRTLCDLPRDFLAQEKKVAADLKLASPADAAKFIEPPPDLRTYWFRDGQGRPSLALWRAVRVEGLAPFVGDVEIGTTAYTQAVATDVYTGRSWAVPVEKTEGGSVLRGLPASNGPVIVRLFR